MCQVSPLGDHEVVNLNGHVSRNTLINQTMPSSYLKEIQFSTHNLNSLFFSRMNRVQSQNSEMIKNPIFQKILELN